MCTPAECAGESFKLFVINDELNETYGIVRLK
jgi:hypothetical protein